MLIATYASALLVCAASLLAGRAIFRLLGRPDWSPAEPAAGLAALLALCSVTIRLPHRTPTTVAALIVLVAACLIYLRGRALPRPGAGLPALAGLAVLALASLPFVASGHLGPLGVGVNNDLAGHLHYAAWLEDPIGKTPTTLTRGYPIGPHGLVAALAKGVGTEPLSAMLGLLLAVPVLTAVSAAGVLRELAPPLRAIAAVLTGLAYLAASALAVGGFKETLMALIVLGFALALRELTRGEGERRGLLLALGVLMAGMLAVYSYPGLLYAALIGALWAALELLAARRRDEGDEVRKTIRNYAPLALIPLVVMLALALVELPRIIDFANSGVVGFVTGDEGRLHEKASPFEAFGVWPSGDYLLGTTGLSAYLLFGLLGSAGLAVGLVAIARRSERALLAAFIGAAVIYVGALLDGGYYVQAKALAIAAPISMLVALIGLLGPWQSARALRAVLGTAFIVVAAYSSFLALRDARVAPRQYAAAQLAQFRPLLHGRSVLSLTSDRFTDYYLRGASVYSPAPYAEEQTIPRAGKLHRLPVDFDSVVPAALDRFSYAVTTSAAYKSAPPSNFREVMHTPDFILWKRTGPTPKIGILPEEERPGSIYNCSNPKLAEIVEHARKQGYTTARVQPASSVGKRLFWKPGTTIGDGDAISQTLHLAKGRWQLSLQYYSPILDLEVDAGNLHADLPATADGGVRYRTDQGPFWPLGAVTSVGKPIDVTVRAGGLSGLQELLGVNTKAEIGNVTAAQSEKARPVPLRAACHLYIDHYTVGPG